MRAAVYRKFGPPEVVRVEDVPDPVPGESEVLIRVHATTVNSADWRLRARAMPAPIFTLIAPLVLGFTGPRKTILGADCAGVVEAVGAKETRFRPGDRVLASVGMRLGAHAELAIAREAGAIAALPAGVSFEDAVAIPFGGMVALRYLRDLAGLRAGQRLLVVGAAGAVGVASVQIGRHLGAHVTAVCSADHVDRVRALGAAEVVDRTTADFTRGDAKYDVVLDAVGATSLATCRGVLAPGGQFLSVVMRLTELVQLVTTRFVGRHRVKGTVVTETRKDIEELIRLVEAGQLKPVIDSTFALSEIVAAHRRVDTGRKLGSVVVRVAE